MIDILHYFCCQGLTTWSPTSRRTGMDHMSDLTRRLEICHCCCCETNFRLEMHLYNYCMNGANLAIASESLMLLPTYVTQLSSVDLQAMPAKLKRQSGAEFLGASAKSAPSSGSSFRNTAVNYTDFEEEEDQVTYVGRGGA